MKNADDILDETLGILDPVEKELGTDNQLLIIGLFALKSSLSLFFLIRMKFRNECILYLNNL